MDLQFVRSHWRSHLPPLFVGAMAVFVLIISPFWAYQWIQVPFLGVSLEQNNVVSQVNGTTWPAHMQGVAFKERLVALNGETVLMFAMCSVWSPIMCKPRPFSTSPSKAANRSFRSIPSKTYNNAKTHSC